MLKPRYSSPNFDAEALIFVFELRCWDLQKPLQNPCAADFLGYFSGFRRVPEDLRKPLQKPPVQTISRDFVPNCPRRPFFRLPSGTQGPPKTLAKTVRAADFPGFCAELTTDTIFQVSTWCLGASENPCKNLPCS